MLHTPSPAQPLRPASPVAGILPALLALPLAAIGIVLAGSALGLRLPLVEVVITAAWARALVMATGAFLLFDGGRMLARLVLPAPPQPESPEEKRSAQRRMRLLSRARMLAGVALLAVLTLALPLQAFHVTRGFGHFFALVVFALLLLAFLSISGSLLGSGSVDASAARWMIPGRTLEKLEAGAGLRGRATIDDLHETGWMVNDQPQIHLALTVHVAGREAYGARVTETAPLLALGHLVRGGALPVLVDADAPEHLIVLWKDL
jgi:hypothetical protein